VCGTFGGPNEKCPNKKVSGTFGGTFGGETFSPARPSNSYAAAGSWQRRHGMASMAGQMYDAVSQVTELVREFDWHPDCI
jgi:hypothetical protein